MNTFLFMRWLTKLNASTFPCFNNRMNVDEGKKFLSLEIQNKAKFALSSKR